MNVLLSILWLTTSASANPGWQAPPGVAAADARTVDVDCRRQAIDRVPGQSLAIDWSRHRACMTAAGFVPVAVQQREARILARAERRRSRDADRIEVADTAPVEAAESPDLAGLETVLGVD